MKVYEVGGAVRDALLGRTIKERDWVVVGSSASELTALGYRPVGKDFPVFLHPVTGEQYALARTERKIGPGYTGFSFDTSADVTLQQDLARRDLTINAIARDESGQIIDPWGGQRDLDAARAAACLAGVSRGPFASLARGAFRRTLQERRFYGGAGDL